MHNTMIHYQTYPTKIGELLIAEIHGSLVLVDYRHRKTRSAIDNRLKIALKTDFIMGNHPVLLQCRQQIDDYLTGRRLIFDLPFLMIGSDFQKSVWQQLLTIPYGKTCTYRSIAEKIGNIKAIRAVASAVGANALSLIIPCHRVIGSDGSLTGYAGGLKSKNFLLDLEKNKSTPEI